MYAMPGSITAMDVDTDRLRTHCLTRGPADGTPVVLVHGNLSTGLFFDELIGQRTGGPAARRAGHAGLRSARRSMRPADWSAGPTTWLRSCGRWTWVLPSTS